ncbi:MAG: filamentous hemagglutinin N-terminal domain-containing protein [Nostocaceae cyanobacterium]|nr:filamentous hemagglutinin N-terminal domain-containing protein [Nostocaceae cyanobacterium]
MKGIYQLGLLGIALLQGFFINPCVAQSSHIVPDNSLGDESSQVIENFQGLRVEAITNGAQRGINLFHSFREFNVSEGRGAYFFIPNAEIQNLLARVTGNNRSEILGTLGTFGNSQPNLFLINPNGIVFGESASLDVGGSFVATTANGINLGETGFFSASEPQRSSLLSVNPSALFFNAVNSQAQIVNRSSATATVLGFAVNGAANRPINGLQVLDGKSLLLVGGNVSLDGGELSAPGGRVELGGLAEPGNVAIAINDSNISLDFSSESSFSNINLTDDARVSVQGVGGGDIFARANTFTATDGGRLVSGTEGIGNAGDIIVTANNVSLSGKGANASSGIYNQSLPGSSGNAGNIFINTRSLSAASGATIKTNTASTGNSGNVKIVSTDSVKLTDGNIETITSDSSTGNAGNITITTGAYLASGFNGYLWSGTTFNGQNAGNISLNADSVTLENRSSIDSSNRFGFGNAGTVEIKAKNDISFSGGSFIDSKSSGQGNGGNIKVQTGGSLSLVNSFIDSLSAFQGNGGNVKVQTGGSVSLVDSDIWTAVLLGSNGQAGDINIQARSFSMTDGSHLLTSGFEEASAGNVNIQTADFVNLDNNSKISSTSRKQTGGDITIETRQLKVNNGSRLFASVLGNQPAGNLTIKASDSVEVSDSSKLLIDTTGNGNAGNLTINTKKLIVRNGAKISSSTLGGSGAGGNLQINASDVVEITGTTPDGLTSSGIEADTGGGGAAGNIKITTGRLIVRDGSRVSSFSVLGSKGKGGKVEVQASELVEVSGIRPSLLASSSLDTSSDGIGNAGDIKISTGKLIVRNGGRVAVSTSGLASGGNLHINATESIEISGQALNGFFPSGIFAQSTSIFTEAAGKGGDIEVKTPLLDISNGGQINATAFGSGDAGNISINVDNLLNMKTGDISTASFQSSGGNIQIQAGNIRLFDDSDITTFVGIGDGGNITLTANTIIALDDSDILSFSSDGKGGDITFNTAGFFSTPLYRPTSPTTDANALAALDGNNRVDVNASGTVSGVIAGVPDITFIDENLTDLPANQIDTNTLIANSCIARSTQRQENSFTITGSGGLRNNPGDELVSIYSTGKVRNVKTTPRPWKKGDPIIEPQGLYKLPDGRLLLSRTC